MSVQIIKDRKGREEYVVLPVRVYRALQAEIDDEIAALEMEAAGDEDYDTFDPADYITSPVAIARMRAGVRQKDLAEAMGVSQAYVSRLEHSERVTEKAMARVRSALERFPR